MVRFGDLSPRQQAFERIVFGRRSNLHSEDAVVLWDSKLTEDEIIATIENQRAERAARREANRLAKVERTARVAARRASPGTWKRYPRRSFRSLCNGSDVIRAAALGVLL